MADSNDEGIAPAPKAVASGQSATATRSEPPASPDPRAEKEVIYLDERIRALRHEVDKLIDERPLLLAALRYQHVGDLVKITLQVMFAIIGFVIVVALGAAMWSAAHDNSLVIEAFSVPPDLAERGLSGQVVASQLLDRLATMQDNTPTARAASAYTHNWGNDIKVAIPNTGISIGDLNRYLRDWLGHETHINGEVYRTAAGIAVTARIGGEAGTTVEGPETSFSKLIQQAAELIYRRTQPYRYSVYLDGLGRTKESDAALQALLAYGPHSEAKWAHLGLANSLETSMKFQESVAQSRAALADDPAFGMAYNFLALGERNLGHDEAALDALNRGLPTLVAGHDPQVTERAAAMLHARMDAQRSAALGDFRAAIEKNLLATKLPDYAKTAGLARIAWVEAVALSHDSTAAYAAMSTISEIETPNEFVEYTETAQVVPTALEEWTVADASAQMVLQTISSISDKTNRHYNPFLSSRLLATLPCHLKPMAALAAAHSGNTHLADTLAEQTPLDCYYALRVRGQIAAIERHWDIASKWFAEAVRQAPSIPFAYADWGRMLMAQGHLDDAMEKFSAAHEKGRNYADALEYWGEALMAQKRSDLALDKFEEASRLAPNWGRLHLKCGEALLFDGRRNAARTQFQMAGTLSLSDAERAELTRYITRH